MNNCSSPKPTTTPNFLESKLPAVLEFISMKEDHPCLSSNQLPAPLHDLKAIAPSNTYKLFRTDKTIATNTNAYAEAKRELPDHIRD
jgi:hypothetical protein